MIFFADKHKTKRSFEEGDEVYLKLQPYRQSWVALRKNLKLSSKCYGPFTILQEIGKVACKLQLPPNNTTHLVFHVSLLKKKISSKYIPSPTLPLTTHDGQFQVLPHKILDRRIITRNNIAIPQILIRWSNSTTQEATWEDYYVISQKFPQFDTSEQES